MKDKKCKSYKSSFKYRVRLRMESEGWTVFPICDSDSPIDLLCFRARYEKNMTVGIRAKAHGHVYQQEREALVALGKELRIGIFYVHESQTRDLVFIRSLLNDERKIKGRV